MADVAGLAAALYVASVVRLRRRGDRLAVVAAGVLAGWLRAAGPDDQRWTGDLRQGPFLHAMLQHMVLMMMVPLLWVLAPVTLRCGRFGRAPTAGLGARETLLQLLHSTSRDSWAIRSLRSCSSLPAW